MSLLHSFGGSALDRHIFDFETNAEGGAGDSGAGADPSPTGEPGASLGETGSAPAWSADDPAFIDAVDGRAAELFQQQLGPLMPLLAQLAQGDGGQSGVPELGPLDPLDESFSANLDARFKALEQHLSGIVDKVAAPLAAREEAETIQRGNSLVDGWIQDDLTANGVLGDTAKAQIRVTAEALLPEMAARFGNGPRAAQAAVRQAAATVRSIVAEAAVSGVQQHTERIDTLRGARTELGAGGGSGFQTFEDKPLSGRELSLKYGSRAQAARTGR